MRFWGIGSQVHWTIRQVELLDPVASTEQGLCYSDVMRLLIPIWQNELKSADHSQEEGSVGQVLETMCHGFLGMSLRTASLAYKDDPARFERIL